MALSDKASQYISKVNEIICGLISIVHEPSNKFSKENIVKIIPKTTELMATIGELVVDFGVMQGELNSMKNITLLTTPSRTNPIDINMNEIVTEMEERAIRSKNIILYNVPESLSEEKAVTITEDRDKVSTAIKNIDPSLDLLNVKVFRLGAKKIANKNRPIKLEFNNNTTPRTLLRNSIKFKDGIKASNDLTILQRNQLVELRKQLLYRQENGEPNLTIKYINSKPTIVTTLPKNDTT